MSSLYRINKKDLIYLFIFVVFIKPDIVEDISALDFIWNLGRFGLTIMFMVFTMFQKNRFKVAKYPVFILILAVISTLLNHGLINRAFANWFPSIGIIIFLDVYKNDLNRVIKVFYYSGGVLTILNAIIVFLFPNGLWIREASYAPVWLLGQKQSFLTCILPTTLFMLLNSSRRKKVSLFDLGVVASIAISVIIAKPVGLMLILLITFGLIMCDLMLGKIISMRKLFVINIIAEAVAIGIAYAYSNFTFLQLLLNNVINSGLSKSTTMGFRFSMWTSAIDIMKKHWLLGIGKYSKTSWINYTGLTFYYPHIHNTFLDIFLVGGLLSELAFLIWLFRGVKTLNRFWNSRKIRFIGIIIFSLNVICLTECPYQPMLLMIYALPFYCRCLFDYHSNEYNYFL